jgi:flagellar biosynthesis GTPase FlhF
MLVQKLSLCIGSEIKKNINYEEIERQRIKKEEEQKEKERSIILKEMEELKADEEKQVQKRGIVSSDLLKKKRQLEHKLSKIDDVSDTEFLLKQRRDLETSNNILKGQTAHDIYKKVSNADLSKDEIQEDDLDQEASFGTSGVLLNKRQF